MIKKTILPILLFVRLGITNLQAQEGKQDLEKAIQNPIASLSPIF